MVEFATDITILEADGPRLPGCSRAAFFTAVADLTRKLRRFITKYNKRAKRVRWAYADPARRIA